MFLTKRWNCGAKTRQNIDPNLIKIWLKKVILPSGFDGFSKTTSKTLGKMTFFDETGFWTTFSIFKSWCKKRDQKSLKNLEKMTHSSESEIGP